MRLDAKPDVEAPGSHRSLDIRGVKVSFGGIHALDGIDLHVDAGEVLGLIGPNGAGKTTLVNVITGYQAPDEGRVMLDGRDVTDMKPAALARLGFSRTFQAARLFPRLSVFENVECAALGVGNRRRDAARVAAELVERMGLSDRADSAASSLPYGDERRLALARALASGPKFLLLDEPCAGMDENETQELLEIIAAVPREQGCGVLVIEHDMSLIMALCQRIQVLAEGRTIAVGSPAEILRNQAVIDAYLGDVEELVDAPG